ncbi:ATP-dependent Clp protease proteolytic subunit [Serratia fonticola]|nr:ATP-dependent Clp protease proteolytic subunit [Serratia fonticola]
MGMSRMFIALLLSTISLSAIADVSVVKKEGVKSDQVNSIKIIYDGDITAREVIQLISAIDEANNEYTNVKEIKLYINSFGGSIESGYLAYEAIKNSSIPIVTINAAMVGSSATLLYCGGKKRLSLASATFMLHPAATPNTKQEYLKNNEIEKLSKSVKDANEKFKYVYQQCTNIDTESLDKILFSEDYSKYLNIDEAIKFKLTSAKETGIIPTQISYYITNKD